MPDNTNLGLNTMDHLKEVKRPGPCKVRKYAIAAVILAGVFVLFMMLWYYVPAAGSNEAAYCARCHAMTPEYLTWQQSSHAQFQCKDCHRESGMQNFLSYQGRIIGNIFYPGARDADKKKGAEDKKDSGGKRAAGDGPGDVAVPDSACLGCHSENRSYSPSSDTVVPHEKHRKAGVNCATCHAGLAHGRIVERGVTEKVNPDEWNQALAKEQMDFKYTTPRMAVCLDCHGKRQVTEKCSVCHSRQIVPASHKSNGFERDHGRTAQEDFKPCNLCHSYSMTKPVDLLEINVRDYIKTNSFCFNCHLQKPSTHKDEDFGKLHAELTKTRGIENCFGCHDINENKNPQDRGPVNKVYCNSCHWFK